jgi:hypothetical protein
MMLRGAQVRHARRPLWWAPGCACGAGG